MRGSSDKDTEELYVSVNACGVGNSKSSRKTGQRAKIDRSLESRRIYNPFVCVSFLNRSRLSLLVTINGNGGTYWAVFQ
jgi:hypothetical protein